MGVCLLFTFNRTIVELKLESLTFTEGSRNAFNRTIVELKFEQTKGVSMQNDLLIVP